MIGARPGGIDAVVAGDKEHVARPHGLLQRRQRVVEPAQRTGVAVGVFAVAIHHVELDQVAEDDATRRAPQELHRRGDGRIVVQRVRGGRNRAAGEDLRDLANALHLQTGAGGEIKEMRGGGRQRPVPPRLVIACVVPAGARKRAGDDASDGVLAAEQLTRELTDAVELGQRHHVLVGCDLEDGVGRSVDDELARAHVLVAQRGDDLGP